MLTNGSTAMVRRSSNGADVVGVACTSGAAAGAGTGAAGVSGAAAIARGSGTAEGASSLARSEEHTSELQSLMRSSYAVFCLKKQHNTATHDTELYDKARQ